MFAATMVLPRVDRAVSVVKAAADMPAELPLMVTSVSVVVPPLVV